MISALGCTSSGKRDMALARSLPKLLVKGILLCLVGVYNMIEERNIFASNDSKTLQKAMYNAFGVSIFSTGGSNRSV